ncbi:hypothetical protein QOT17_005607 [Balamuthia mandrillaris]
MFIPPDDWPLNSLDLSLIQNLWAIISDKVQAQNPKTLKELQEAMNAAWDEISLAQIKRLIVEQFSNYEQLYTFLGDY